MWIKRSNALSVGAPSLVRGKRRLVCRSGSELLFAATLPSGSTAFVRENRSSAKSAMWSREDGTRRRRSKGFSIWRRRPTCLPVLLLLHCSCSRPRREEEGCARCPPVGRSSRGAAVGHAFFFASLSGGHLAARRGKAPVAALAGRGWRRWLTRTGRPKDAGMHDLIAICAASPADHPAASFSAKSVTAEPRMCAATASSLGGVLREPAFFRCFPRHGEPRQRCHGARAVVAPIQRGGSSHVVRKLLVSRWDCCAAHRIFPLRNGPLWLPAPRAPAPAPCGRCQACCIGAQPGGIHSGPEALRHPPRP